MSEPAPVLLVDDSAANRKAIEAVLAPLQVSVVHAASGREALRALLEHDFALLLLDVHMRDLDGFETAALIRQRPRNRNLPIIFVTAHDQTEADLARGYALGAVDFVHTPINPEVLRAKAAVFVDLFMKADEIQRLYSEAASASRAKSEFLNMAAHELRTPLSVIRGYTSMLLDGTLAELGGTVRQPLQIIEAKAAELNEIVDSMLTTARIDFGRMPARVQTVDLVEAVVSALHRAEGRRAQLGAELQRRLPSSAVPVKADATHVGRILDNLINNALTYCSGAPRIEVSIADGATPRVVVQDNGVGIPPDRREAVFDRFVRLDDPGIGPTPGTGLGLYISRELARLAGGDLVLESSEPGAGSRFALTLPAPPFDVEPAADEYESRPAGESLVPASAAGRTPGSRL